MQAEPVNPTGLTGRFGDPASGPAPLSARSPGNRRDRHLTREHVPLADVLAGQVTISRVGARPRAAQGARAGRGCASLRAGRRSREPRPTVRIASPSSDRGRDVPADPVRSSGARLVVGVLVVVAARPAAALRAVLGGAGCPNLLQRPGSRRSAGSESLIFRASSRGRSRPGAPLQQIWTTARPESSQEPHAHHRAGAPATANPDEGGGALRGGAPGRFGRPRPAGRPRDGAGGARRARPAPPPRRSSCMAGRRLACRDAADPGSVRCALFRPLRPFTLRCAPFSRTAEGEGAQQTERGAAEGRRARRGRSRGVGHGVGLCWGGRARRGRRGAAADHPTHRIASHIRRSRVTFPPVPRVTARSRRPRRCRTAPASRSPCPW